MTKFTSYLLLAALFSTAATPYVFAQTAATPEVGANPYKSYSGGDIDHIQMQNGSLFLHIPLVSYPQLGKLDLSISLVANSPQLEETVNCDQSGDCTYAYQFNGPDLCDGTPGLTGQSNAWVVVDQDLGLSACDYEPVEYVINGDTDQINFYNVYSVVDSSQAVHTLGYDQNNWSTLQATDGSGYTVQMPWANTLNGASYQLTPECPNPDTTVITDSSGVKQTTTRNCTPQGSSYSQSFATTFSDPAGNTIQRSATTTGYWGVATGTIVDSVGRHIPDPTLAIGAQLYAQLGSLPPGMTLDPNPSAVCPNLSIPGEPVAYSVSWGAPGYQGGTSTYHFCFSTVTVGTNFFGAGVGAQSGTTIFQGVDDSGDSIYITYLFQDMLTTYNVLQSVVLPNGTSWGFAYNTQLSPNQVSLGDLIQVNLPSGGSINYGYTTIPVCGLLTGDEVQPVTRAVISRSLSPLVGEPVSTSYSYIQPTESSTTAKTIETDANGNDIAHIFTLDYGFTSGPCGAEETTTRWYQGSSNGGTSGTILKEIDTAYTYEMNPQDDYTDVYRTHINQLPQTKTTYLNGTLQSSLFYNYDTLFTASQTVYTEGAAYGYGAFPTTAPIRYEVPTYVNDGTAQVITTRMATIHPAYHTAGFVALPQSVIKEDESNNEVSETIYAYDDPTCSPSGALGNLTSTTKDYDTKTSWCYNSMAMPTSTTNPNGNAGIANGTTSYSYDLSGLYITQIQKPTTGGTQQHIRYYSQDANTGWTTGISDENASSISDSAHTTYYNSDQMGRLTQVNYPDGGQLTQCFTDQGGATCNLSAPPYRVITKRLQSVSPSVWQQSTVTYDGLGRSLFTEAPNSSYTASGYDNVGNLCVQSNPSFSPPPTLGLSCTSGQNPAPVTVTDGYTYFAYDALHRKVTITNPDTSTQNWTYTGKTITFQDESGSQWQRTYNSHERLIQIVEPGSLNTTYSYNTRDNLITIYQQGVSGETPRTRSFSYDSLSRLITSTNPETGTICYGVWSGGSCVNGYDADSNLVAKTDANQIVTSYSYDNLDRILTRNSSEYTVSDTYAYDDPTPGNNGIGRLMYSADVFNGTFGLNDGQYNNGMSQFTYDAVGRVASRADYSVDDSSLMSPTAVVRDVAGHVIQMTYPSGRTLVQTWNNAGQLNTITDSSNNVEYLTGASYAANGAVGSMTFGNGATQSFSYNSRQQECENKITSLLLNSSTTIFDKQTFVGSGSSLCGAASGNNGNISSIVDALNTNLTRTFTYDTLNRLLTAVRSDNGFNYSSDMDSFGNMKQVNNLAGNPDVSFNNYNQIEVGFGGYSYDAAGNLLATGTAAQGGHAYTYDAKNQLSIVDSWGPYPDGAAAFYLYGADGDRSMKWTRPASDDTWWYWDAYSYFDGHVVSENINDDHFNDLIYANGKQIARVDGAAPAMVLSASSCTWNVPTPNGGFLMGDVLTWNESHDQSVQSLVEIQSSNNSAMFESGSTWADDDWHAVAVGLGFPYLVAPSVKITWIQAGSFQSGGFWTQPTGGFSASLTSVVLSRADGTVQVLYGNSTSSTTTPVCSGGSASPAPTWDTNPIASVHYIFNDNLDTAQLMLTASGAPEWRGEFLPYGGEIDTNATLNNFKFTGKERDPESGYDYFGMRYYASGAGRFISPDPIWVKDDRILLPQRLNLYAYTATNPIRFSDPTGMDLTIRNCPGNMTTSMCEAAILNGVPKNDRGHIHFVEGDGTNGYAKGQTGILVDADYHSASGIFADLQKAANDHSAVANINFEHSGFRLQGLFFASEFGFEDIQTASRNETGSYADLGQGIVGYTFFGNWGSPFPDRPYSTTSATEVYIDIDEPAAQVAGTVEHEIVHVLAGDFGRLAQNGGHPDVDRATSRAQKEGEKNAKQQ